MLTLRPITHNDIRLLDALQYGTMSDEEKRTMINESIAQSHNGNFFELLPVFDGDLMVGIMNLYAHAPHVISCGPEITETYRQRGYAYEAEKLALAYAKELGYTVAVAQVREDNTASCALHEKLGFECDGFYENRNGRPVRYYVMAL